MRLARRQRIRAFLLLPLALATAAPMAAQRPAEEEASTREFRLTASERRLAADLAEREMARRQLRTGGPLYLIGAELLRDKEPEREGRRLALLTHFRPEGSLEIKALIDLAGQRILEFTARENPNASMSREEIEAAVALTLADPQVRAALGEDLARVQVEGLHLLTSDPRDPLYGHRAVRMLFKVGKLYRSAPVVIVDLTTRSVTIAPPRPAPDHH